MKKQLLEELKVIKKYMYYSESKTDSENLRLLEQVEGPNPEGNSGGGTGGRAGGGTGGRATRSPLQIPSELANSAGVKKFQDWLVANNFGSELGRYGADSKFGSFTKAAWDKHKNEYLAGPVDDDFTPDASEGGAEAVYSNTQPTTQQSVVQQTPTQQGTSLDGEVPQNAAVNPTQDQLPE